MQVLVDNWYMFVQAATVIITIILGIKCFVQKEPAEQLAKVKEWLIYAVTEAEKQFGGGTGQIKLRYVYDLFVTKFPFLTSVVSFETFSKMVDDALITFRKMLEENKSIKAYVENK